MLCPNWGFRYTRVRAELRPDLPEVLAIPYEGPHDYSESQGAIVSVWGLQRGI